MARTDMQQKVIIDLWTTENVMEQLEHIWDTHNHYTFDELEELGEVDEEGFIKYRLVWLIDGYVTVYRSNSWYEPDDYDWSDDLLPDQSDITLNIEIYLKEKGIDKNLVDIDYIDIKDPKPIWEDYY